MTNNPNKLSLLGHIGELRNRLIRSVLALAITVSLSFIFYNQIFDIMLAPAPEGITLIYTEMTEMIGTTMKVAMTSGIILAVPYLTYEVIMFVSPALTSKEKKYVLLILPWIALMFAAGVVFTYFVLLPPMINFLLTFGSDIATPQIKIGNYISLVTRLLLAFGIVFEAPVVTTFLARIGVLNPAWLAGKRKIAIIVAFILAAVITPTIDPINQLIVTLPLILLFEMSIWLAKLVYKKETAAPAA